MKNIVNLFWYRHPEGAGNFGDELNPYIVDRLSANKVMFYDINNNIQLYSFRERIHKLLFSKNRLNLLFQIIKPPRAVLAIGSVLGWNRCRNVVVWGSGIMSKNEQIYPAKFLAVRGKYTQKRLRELGLKAPVKIGDPGLLLPLVLSSKNAKRYKLGVIPHFIHFQSLRDQNINPNVIIINLLDPIEKIVEEINSCELILSTSLHGIIVSHAYDIPARWAVFTETSGKQLGGDDIKFWDYYSSVDLPEMRVLPIGSITDSQIIEKVYKEYSKLPDDFLPDLKKIEKVQKDLLSVAPFPLKRKFIYE